MMRLHHIDVLEVLVRSSARGQTRHDVVVRARATIPGYRTKLCAERLGNSDFNDEL